MKNWEMVAEAVVAGTGGIVVEKSVTIPVTTGNTTFDQIINFLIGVGAMYVGVKYVDNQAAAIAVIAGGAGWSVGAGAQALGYSI